MDKNNLSLHPANRVDFTTLFNMPEYEVESIIGTTYCLNYETLLMLILAVTYGPGANRAMDGTVDEISPAALFAAIGNMRGKLKVYCQMDKAVINLGGGKGNDSIQRIEGLLDEFVRPVPMIKINENFSSFHPKVWYIFFKPTEESGKKRRKYRFVVTSRNLTSNRDFDATAVFEDNYSELPEWAKPERAEVDAAADLDKVLDNGFSPENKKITDVDLKKCHSIVSPFLDGDLLSRLKSNDDIRHLNIFSLRSEINQVWMNHQEEWPELLSKFQFYCFNPALEAQVDETFLRSIHAKLYIGDSLTILGSSNFTGRGWNSNREFNVQLDQGITQNDLLKQFGVDKEGNYGRGLFVPYAPSDMVEKKTEDPPLLQQLAGVILHAEWDGEKLRLSIENRLGANLSKVQWKPLLGKEWKTGPDLNWNLAEADVTKTFLCQTEGRELQMLASLTDKTGKDIWERRYETERKKISPADELNFRMLQAIGERNLFNYDIPLKRNSGVNTSHRVPQPPVFERMLKMDQEELRRFFKDEIPEWDETNDPIGQGQALRELKTFFGIEDGKK